MRPDPLRRPLDPDRLRNLLQQKAIPWQLEVVEQTGSTNSDLVARAREGRNVDGFVLIAEHQTSGRGRAGRDWTAVPRAQILLSVGVGVGTVPAEMWGWVPLAMGVAVVDALSFDGGVVATLKWPNDVLVGGLKLAGILAEVAAPEAVIVVGLGLNVSLRTEEVADVPMTSLFELNAPLLDREILLTRVLDQFSARVSEWRTTAGTSSALKADYAVRSATIGSTVRVQLPGEESISGMATAVDGQGRLLVRRGQQIVALSAGDVVHVRPANDGDSVPDRRA